MIEIRTYTYDEMSAILGTRSNQGIKRKLDKYEIECHISGRGVLYEIRYYKHCKAIYGVLHYGAWNARTNGLL